MEGLIKLTLDPDQPYLSAQKLQDQFRQYAELITPWATSVSNHLIAGIAKSNERAWRARSQDISRALITELVHAPTGHIYHELMERQVGLIRSLPIKAAEHLHELTEIAMVDGQRADTLVETIMGMGEVTKSRARMIARTEVSRSASTLTEARSRHVGSDGYIWRTSGDGDVRPTHRAQNGKFIRWDAPPKTDKGLAPYHAGCGPNCRCYPDPQLPE